MARQHRGGHESVQDDGTRGAEPKCAAHEDKGWPITSRRPIGEKKHPRTRTATDFVWIFSAN